jgi:hypothetical protein
LTEEPPGDARCALALSRWDDDGGAVRSPAADVKRNDRQQEESDVTYAL